MRVTEPKHRPQIIQKIILHFYFVSIVAKFVKNSHRLFSLFLRFSFCVSWHLLLKQRTATRQKVLMWRNGRMGSERFYPTSTLISAGCPVPPLPRLHHPPPPPAWTTQAVSLTASAGTAQPAGWTLPSSQVRVSDLHYDIVIFVRIN